MILSNSRNIVLSLNRYLLIQSPIWRLDSKKTLNIYINFKSTLIQAVILAHVLLLTICLVLSSQSVLAASLRLEKLYYKETPIQFQTKRLYAIVKETSGEDFEGYVWIKIYKDNKLIYAGNKIQLFVIGGKYDGIFWDIPLNVSGKLTYKLEVAQTNNQPNPILEKIEQITVYADSDKDRIPNNIDLDDDNDGLADIEEEKLGTDPLDPDTDDDGILDKDDIFPRDSTEWEDTDHDGIGDNKDPDDDNDGLLDSEEIKYHTNPKEKDSDHDGLSDKEEIEKGTNPLAKDSDADGVPDALDIDPTDATKKSIIQKNKNSSNSLEHPRSSINSEKNEIYNKIPHQISQSANKETNQNHLQTDSESNNNKNNTSELAGNSEYQEISNNKENLTPKSVLNKALSFLGINLSGTKDADHDGIEDDKDPDDDNDGLSDKEEAKYNTNPKKRDTDNDGLTDKEEIKIYHTNPHSKDTDTDGISDKDEIENKLDPLDPRDALQDFDNDGINNSEEIKLGTNLFYPQTKSILGLKIKDTWTKLAHSIRPILFVLGFPSIYFVILLKKNNSTEREKENRFPNQI